MLVGLTRIVSCWFLLVFLRERKYFFVKMLLMMLALTFFGESISYLKMAGNLVVPQRSRLGTTKKIRTRFFG